MATPTQDNDKAPRDTHSARSDRDGKTKVEQGGETAPKLPHERDESSGSHENRADSAAPTEIGKRAHDDVKRGVVDTSRGAETDRVYNDELKP